MTMNSQNLLQLAVQDLSSSLVSGLRRRRSLTPLNRRKVQCQAAAARGRGGGVLLGHRQQVALFASDPHGHGSRRQHQHTTSSRPLLVAVRAASDDNRGGDSSSESSSSGSGEGDDDEQEDADDGDDKKKQQRQNSSSSSSLSSGSGLSRADLERLVGPDDDAKFNGLDLANLIRKKYGRSYDVTLIKKEFMGRNLLAMNVMWKYREQRSFPLSEEEYLLRLDDVANTLKCWGAVAHVRNTLEKLKERPRIGKAVSIFIDMDQTGARADEWIYK
ncbi:hypothetical protein BS78_04G329000 [Paspalum vaginatum]|nr:hypothetical protein BS78_04G329000 [Paspalum vaginatum]KAJ1281744.1 hypothetical protein BS78_04G329000 [Paspalum vaginatum]